MVNKQYICEGVVRGWCGHKHRNLEVAMRCCNEDNRGSYFQGRDSDRNVYVLVDGIRIQVPVKTWLR